MNGPIATTPVTPPTWSIEPTSTAVVSGRPAAVTSKAATGIDARLAPWPARLAPRRWRVRTVATTVCAMTHPRGKDHP